MVVVHIRRLTTDMYIGVAQRGNTNARRFRASIYSVFTTTSGTAIPELSGWIERSGLSLCNLDSACVCTPYTVKSLVVKLGFDSGGPPAFVRKLCDMGRWRKETNLIRSNVV